MATLRSAPFVEYIQHTSSKTDLTFAGAVPTIDQVAFDLQAHVDNRIMFNAIISRLGQAIVGEMSLEEAWVKMDEDVEKQLKEKYGG